MNFGMVSRSRYAYGSSIFISARNSGVPIQSMMLVVDVVVHGVGPGAVHPPVMDERRLDVQHVDHRGSDRDDAAVDRRRGPRRPAALRPAGDDERVDGFARRPRESR